MSRSNGTLLAALLLAGCNIVEGNGVRESRTFEPGAFTGVRVTHGIEATYTEGAAGPAVLTGDTNLLDLLDVRLEDGDLVVDLKERDRVASPLLAPTAPITFTFSAPTLERISASGGSKLTAAEVNAGALTVRASGSSTLALGTLATGAISAELSGGSHLAAAGTGTSLAATFSGGSTGDTVGLTVPTATFAFSGGSAITIGVTDRIDGAASGGSRITIRGQPAGELGLSGGSTVTRE